jgi:hypothetical protein
MEDTGVAVSDAAAPGGANTDATAPGTSDPEASSTKRRRLITRGQYLSDEANTLMGLKLSVSTCPFRKLATLALLHLFTQVLLVLSTPWQISMCPFVQQPRTTFCILFHLSPTSQSVIAGMVFLPCTLGPSVHDFRFALSLLAVAISDC